MLHYILTQVLNINKSLFFAMFKRNTNCIIVHNNNNNKETKVFTLPML